MPPRFRTSAGKAAEAPVASKGRVAFEGRVASTGRVAAKATEQQTQAVHDIAVVGAGLAGLAQARMLQERGFATCLIDPRNRDDLQALSSDRRATALTPTSVQLLGLPADWLAAKGQQIGSMVVDAGLASALREDEALRLASGAWVVRNADLFAFLAENTGLDGSFGQGVTGSTVQAGQRRLEMAGGDAVSARLVIAADGRNSTLRREDGIQRQQQDFGQIALTGVIRHETPHAGRAFQRFLRGGTFALLPLPADDEGEGRTSSFIWVEPSATAKGLFALEPSILIERMQSRFGDALGRLSKTDNEDWGQFPLLAHSCDRIIGERLALIGEAAHSIHPLAGQGLNLSIKDAAALADAMVEQGRYGLDPGDAQALERYQRARRAETARMSGVTTGLNGLFSRPGGPLRAAAAAGLQALDRMGPLKALLEREARR